MLGGIRSGKSQWAEQAVTEVLRSRGTRPELMRYVATGPGPGSDRGTDPAWAERVTDHRRRRPSAWQTRETTDVASELRADPSTPALVDDLGGWLTAVLDRRGWQGGSITEDIDDLVDAVGDFDAPLVLVSPEVGLTVVPATAAGGRFVDELGQLNQRLAACCDRVVLVVAGQPVQVKPAAGMPG